MANPPAAPIVKHQRSPLKITDLMANLLTHSATLTTLNISNAVHTQVTLSTTAPQSAGFLIQTFSYSYDGVLHVDSYMSDI